MGVDTFQYTICDNGTPVLCDTATVTITVIPDNGNITVANDDSITDIRIRLFLVMYWITIPILKETTNLLIPYLHL